MASLVFFTAFFMLYSINELGKLSRQSASRPKSFVFKKAVQAISDVVSKLKAKLKTSQTEKPAEPEYPEELVANPDWSVYDTPSFRRI
ncbi:hypothetical protein [Salinisphaera sp. T31B1]|uniref:hypothetical protein n=1 Tax=Salinisphaera sp. T31B1 TaxID=727963 RepID=UPI003342719C